MNYGQFGFFPNNNFMINSNQNNNDDEFPDQRNLKLNGLNNNFNQNLNYKVNFINNMNKNLMMNNMYNNLMMNNMNNNMMMNNMNNNMMMNNMNNNMMINNNINKMNYNMINNMNNNIQMNNNLMMNNNMLMNNMNNNMIIYNINNYNRNFLNWYYMNTKKLNFPYFYTNLDFYRLKIQNQILRNNYLQMIINQRYVSMILKMKKIFEESENKNNEQNFDDLLNEKDENNSINQALLDVISEPNPLQDAQNDQNIQIQNSLCELNSDLFISLLNLNKDLFNGYGNNLDSKWAKGENRGGKVYKPPEGWGGYGLNVLNKYDDGNNDWLACNGRPGEWCIAYHGVARGKSSDEVKNIVRLVLENNLKAGKGQSLKNKRDDNHPGQLIGVGVYCSPNPLFLNSYAGTMQIEGINYRVGFMLRVKPDKIRYSNQAPDEWILNGNFSEIRPYRLLVKKA